MARALRSIARGLVAALACTAFACGALVAPVIAAEGEAAGRQKPLQPTGRSLTIASGAGPQDGAEASGCFAIDEIRIAGIELIDDEDIRQAVAPKVRSCVTTDDLNAIVGAVNALHADRGYVTTQAYVPEQDVVASRALALNVFTGRVDAITYREEAGDEALPLGERLSKAWGTVEEARGLWGVISGLSGLLDTLDDPLDRFQILDGASHPGLKPWFAFAIGPGDVLQLHDVQHGVDQINRVGSGHAEAKLEAGEAPATSNVVVVNRPADSFRLLAGYEINGADINGSGQTVANRLRLDLSKDNLIGISDAWQLSYAGGVDSNEVRAAASLPFRRFTFSFAAGYSESLTEIVPTVDLFSRSGTVTGGLSYALVKNADRLVAIDGSLQWRRSERFVNSAQLTPQALSVARLGLSETLFFDKAQLSYGAGINRGLPVLGATKDAPDLPADAPHAQFWKLDAFAGFAKAVPDIGLLRLDLAAQFSPVPLYGDDEMTLGSSSTVRGFTNGAVKVDSGAVLRSEFAFAVPADAIIGDLKDDLVLAHEVLSALQPYVFADLGYGRNLAEGRNLARAGLGAGLRYRHGRLNLDASIAQPVYQRGLKGPTTPEVYLTASFKLL
ncbi:hemolysin activation/secretion protein [Chelatococcus caeni]|uniref:Hemolysin activation/secretion protein n=1 Tax=Chelatococcus caeni TaxID=1348468 RepID=A0A840C0E2_9HYPH|nr:ShlB/FhaC/HecB family hemolysin secretion/activation protein [Chelatococcus caeni]MBB4017442.1 hemolysin activation/secretion protein [Chelatococcus caeni]